MRVLWPGWIPAFAGKTDAQRPKQTTKMFFDFPNTWRNVPLVECMSAIIDYRGVTPQKTTSGVPLVTAKIIKSGRILHPDEFIAEEEYENWMRRGLPEAGDVVMTTEAPLGQIAQLGSQRVALAQRIITLRGKPELLDNTFLRFLMQSQYVQDQLKARSSGTTVLGIKQSELRKIELVIPPLDEQKAIAGVLGALDDKIELNRRMNETLEAMARAIFKSWFVDFDPVRAKAEGRAPAGMDADTAALFPDSFVDSALGEIPAGWHVVKISDVIELAYGKPLKENERVKGRFPVYGSNGQIGWHNTFLVKGPGIIVGRKGNPGVVTWAHHSFYPIDTTFYVIPIHKDTSLHWMFHVLKGEDLASLSADSAVPGLNRNHAYLNDICLPNVEVQKTFDVLMANLMNKTAQNEAESMVLVEIRDTLLPKLLSGEVRVKDAERTVTDAIK